jgi:hypothetical protein
MLRADVHRAKPIRILSAGVLRRNTSAIASSNTSICPGSSLKVSIFYFPFPIFMTVPNPLDTDFPIPQ